MPRARDCSIYGPRQGRKCGGHPLDDLQNNHDGQSLPSFAVKKPMTEASEPAELQGPVRAGRDQDKGKMFNTDLIEAHELGCMLDCSEAIVAGALARKESRGAHYRSDFEARDDVNWLGAHDGLQDFRRHNSSIRNRSSITNVPAKRAKVLESAMLNPVRVWRRQRGGNLPNQAYQPRRSTSSRRSSEYTVEVEPNRSGARRAQSASNGITMDR